MAVYIYRILFCDVFCVKHFDYDCEGLQIRKRANYSFYMLRVRDYLVQHFIRTICLEEANNGRA